MALAMCEEAHPILFQASAAAQSYLYRKQAACQAQLDMPLQSQKSLELAYKAFATHPTSPSQPNHFEKTLAHASHTQIELFLWEGITRWQLGQYEVALDVLQKGDPLGRNSIIPERVRAGFFNNLVLAEIGMPSPQRDLERCITHWKAGIQSAMTLKSEFRFNEAYRAYEGLQVAFPHEPRIKQLRKHIQKWIE